MRNLETTPELLYLSVNKSPKQKLAMQSKSVHCLDTSRTSPPPPPPPPPAPEPLFLQLIIYRNSTTDQSSKDHFFLPTNIEGYSSSTFLKKMEPTTAMKEEPRRKTTKIKSDPIGFSSN